MCSVVNLGPRSYRVTVTEMYNRLAVNGLDTRLVGFLGAKWKYDSGTKKRSLFPSKILDQPAMQPHLLNTKSYHDTDVNRMYITIFIFEWWFPSFLRFQFYLLFSLIFLFLSLSPTPPPHLLYLKSYTIPCSLFLIVYLFSHYVIIFHSYFVGFLVFFLSVSHNFSFLDLKVERDDIQTSLHLEFGESRCKIRFLYLLFYIPDPLHLCQNPWRHRSLYGTSFFLSSSLSHDFLQHPHFRHSQTPEVFLHCHQSVFPCLRFYFLVFPMFQICTFEKFFMRI